MEGFYEKKVGRFYGKRIEEDRPDPGYRQKCVSGFVHIP